MIYMLDTNICVYMMNEHPKHVIEKYRTLLGGDAIISSIVWSELSYGAFKSHHKERNLASLDKFIIPIQVAPYDTKAGTCFGEIRATLEKQGNIIGSYDLMIAAHALSINATLVTNNTKEFSRIKHLRCENWA